MPVLIINKNMLIKLLTVEIDVSLFLKIMGLFIFVWAPFIGINKILVKSRNLVKKLLINVLIVGRIGP